MNMRRIAAWLAATLFAACACAQGDAWPGKPIRIITPTPVGVGSDMFARVYADRLSKALNVPVVVENRPGALSTLGTAAVAKAAPDGYTILFSTGNPFTMAPYLMAKMPYDAEKDLVPVTQVLRGGSFVVANKDFPAKTLRELVAQARAHPGQVSFASYGPGSTAHLGFELLQDAAGIELLHVPYKQSAMPDVISGQVQLGWEPPASALPNIKAGRVVAIAYTGSHRSSALPDVPTLAELFPGLEVNTWLGFWAPAGTPAAVVQKLQAALVAITRSPEMAKLIEDNGANPSGTTPAEMAQFQKAEAQAMSRIIRAKNIRVD